MSSSSSAVCGSFDVVRALSRTTTEVRSGGGLKYPQQSLFNGSSAAGSGAFSGKPAAELRSSFRGERVAVVKVVSSGSSSRTAKKKNKGHSCGSITAELSLVEYAPLTAAVYGVAILGGGLFACKKTVFLQGPRPRRHVVFSPCLKNNNSSPSFNAKTCLGVFLFCRHKIWQQVFSWRWTRWRCFSWCGK